ncbi:UDP-glycosyltransferase 91A1-like [Impatiens glandulifera]|uniref:UDP-glycosyltransferase 91A1-like n=1 Tax=Impatiens glandulifera TaxID=253017 RepID=UPI001FB0D120|nr:UDP-glycosyltransferase 91A1-like [Impatiens glandulifera]
MSSMAEKINRKLHIVMFPWLAFGHMIPYLNLAKLIAQKGHTVSFVSTPRNIDRLPRIPPHLSSHLVYVKIARPPVDGLPEYAEATTDLPYDKVQLLKKAYDGMQDPMALFLQASNPNWVMYDFATYWMGPLAARLGIRSAFFSILIAACVGFTLGPAEALFNGGDNGRNKLEDFTVPASWSPPGSTVSFRIYEILRIQDSLSDNDGGLSDILRFAGSTVNCDVIAVRSCSEFEPEWIRVLEEVNKKAVFPVGQLAPLESDMSDDNENEEWREIKMWLDNREKDSVVYVAFGSEAKPTQEELTGLAVGLEKSGLSFFWVLKTRRGEFDPDVLELPNGFEERTKGRGWVCRSWAPQMKILGHESVGGFLTHCGWSSVVEAVYLEKPLILLTFLADQGINARVLEEKKMGHPIPRDEKDGSFTSESVAESLRLVMVEEQGRIYRDKMKEMKPLFCDKERQDKYVDTLLSYFQDHRGQSTRTN